MKTSVIIVIVGFSLGSCKYFEGDKEKVETTAVVSQPVDTQLRLTRDTTIDSTNAYNTLSVDTAAIGSYIIKHKLTEAEADDLRGFYNPRNYQFAWFTNIGLTEQGRAFWNAYTYAKSHSKKENPNDKALVARMDSIVGEDTVLIAQTDTAYLQTEVALTNRFIQYYRNSNSESLIRQVPLIYLIPARKLSPLAMADTVLRFNATTDSVAKPYAALKQQLVKYDSIAKQGGWQPIHAAHSLVKGKRDSSVTALKKRLQLTGDYMGTDTTSKYNDSLEVAIKAMQERNGFEPDGVITDSLLAILNIPVEERIEQILINMNRMAWLPPEVKENFVSVNIPEFMLHVYDGDSVPVSMRVVVGKEGTHTVMFTGDLNEVVFSPEWNLPASIVKDEIVPAMNADPGYLKSKRMVVVGKRDSLPEIKQLSGPGNALGKVKFLFPNSYDIYLHDTEAKELFQDKKRAFSHGCIRLADAEELSRYVLRNNAAWSSDKINAAMNGSKPQSVAVKNPIPVVITYFTTWVDKYGQLQFRDDVYQQDKRTASMMFKSAI